MTSGEDANGFVSENDNRSGVLGRMILGGVLVALIFGGWYYTPAIRSWWASRPAAVQQATTTVQALGQQARAAVDKVAEKTQEGVQAVRETIASKPAVVVAQAERPAVPATVTPVPVTRPTQVAKVQAVAKVAKPAPKAEAQVTPDAMRPGRITAAQAEIDRQAGVTKATPKPIAVEKSAVVAQRALAKAVPARRVASKPTPSALAVAQQALLMARQANATANRALAATKSSPVLQKAAFRQAVKKPAVKVVAKKPAARHATLTKKVAPKAKPVVHAKAAPKPVGRAIVVRTVATSTVRIGG